MELPLYQSHKKVRALEIKKVSVEHNGTSTLSFEDEGYVDIQAPLEMFARYKPIAGDFMCNMKTDTNHSVLEKLS